MQSFKVEFLIAVDRKEVFCNSINSLNNFLKSSEEITVSDNFIEYDSLKIEYEVQMGDIATENQRYFHIKLTSNNKSEIEKFERFLKNIRTLLFKASSQQVQVLWDDLSYYYTNQAYPLIHEIENILRKLITKFMLTNVGLSWFKEASPQEVIDSIRNKSSKNSHNHIYEADFIQLSNFLFKEYTSISAKNLAEKIKTVSRLEDLSLDELKSFVPKSNWERYFSALVDCESEYLSKRWENLYQRRNQVAHNKSMSKQEFNEVVQLIDDVKPKLQEAIGKLDQITLPEEDKESIIENAEENLTNLTDNDRQVFKVLREAGESAINPLTQIVLTNLKGWMSP